MITLNLLTPEQKKKLKTKKIYLSLKETVMLILLFTSIIGIMLIAARYVLEQQLAYLIEKNATVITKSQETSKKIASVNEKIETADIIQKNFQNWSIFFIELAEITPKNISYDFLKIYRQQATIELEGSAKTRQDLLALQKNLQNSNIFKKVNLPLSDLLAKTDNHFRIRAELDLAALPEK